MSRWFRVYDDMVDDPKVQRLAPDLFKALINLWCLTSKAGGVLPCAEDIAFKLRIKSERVTQIISALHDAGLIETDETGLRPHNWDSRQFKSDVSNERVKRHRNAKRNVTLTVTETPPDTESDTERKKDAPPAAAPLLSMSDEMQCFARAETLFGKKSGGFVVNLVRAKGGNYSLALAALATASTKQNPREYIGAIIKGADPPDDARARGDAW